MTYARSWLLPGSSTMPMCRPIRRSTCVHHASSTGRRNRAAGPCGQVSGTPYQVRALLDSPALRWQTLELHANERGFFVADFARLLVWTVHEGCVRQEWLLIRQDAEQATFTLSNAALGTPLVTMAYRRSLRYFIERSNQDAKSELGWDEFQAIKFRAWEHQLALTILASWFVAETCLDWNTQFQRSPLLRQQYEAISCPGSRWPTWALVACSDTATAAFGRTGHRPCRQSPG